MEVRLSTLVRNTLSVRLLYFVMLKLMEFPTINRKVGNTKSVRVKPCHLACSKGAKVVAPLPGELTIIIRAISRPLKMSSDR